jgi:hypothetical protein
MCVAERKEMASRSVASKKFNLPKDVRIERWATSDGGEKWDAVISSKAMQRLAKAAGVQDLSWLHDPLRLLMIQVHFERYDRAPSTPNIIDDLRRVQLASRRLQTLLSPNWIMKEMRSFEDRELKQRFFGTRGFLDLTTKAYTPEVKEYFQTWLGLEEIVRRDTQAVRRIHDRVTTMINQLQNARRPTTGGARNLPKQYIADSAIAWWTTLGHGEARSKNFLAFADQLYRLAGFGLSLGAVRAQLRSAIKRRNSRRTRA